MSHTDVYCGVNEDHTDCYSDCLMCEIAALSAENKKLGEQVAGLQHSTGACEMIRREQKIERLVELISKAIPLYWVVADDMDLAAEWEIEANKLLAEVAK